MYKIHAEIQVMGGGEKRTGGAQTQNILIFIWCILALGTMYRKTVKINVLQRRFLCNESFMSRLSIN